jgi:hypothetical protein
MNEELLNRLRNGLQRRTEGLQGAPVNHFFTRLRRFWAYLSNEEFFRPILTELGESEKGNEAAAKAIDIGGRHHHKFDRDEIPPIHSLRSDTDYAAMVYSVLRAVAVNDEAFCHHLITSVWSTHKATLVGDVILPVQADDHYALFKTEALSPFCLYLSERLDEQQALLGILVRYKHRSEWFNRRDLLKIAQGEEDERDARREKGEKKAQAKIEDVLKEDFYRYLHDQGINFVIEPQSPRGRIDSILVRQGGNGAYLEGKVFDNKGRGKPYIIKGFGQLLKYLRDYNAANGYLFIYRTCEEQPVIEGADELAGIPFVRCEQKVVFIVVIDIHEYTGPASVQPYKPVRISADELRKAELSAP